MAIRMRTIREAIAELRETDTKNSFSEVSLRRLVKTGEIKHITVGNRVLVNMEQLEEYLGGAHRAS